jgi:hypothetical protein
MSRLAPVTTSISTASPALKGYWLSFTIAAGIVTYCVFELRLCRMRVRAFKTMRDSLSKPCGGRIEKAAVRDNG